MRNAETILTIIQERGKKGQNLEDVYRQLYNPDLYLRAYGRIGTTSRPRTERMRACERGSSRQWAILRLGGEDQCCVGRRAVKPLDHRRMRSSRD